MMPSTVSRGDFGFVIAGVGLGDFRSISRLRKQISVRFVKTERRVLTLKNANLGFGHGLEHHFGGFSCDF